MRQFKHFGLYSLQYITTTIYCIGTGGDESFSKQQDDDEQSSSNNASEYSSA